jgi:amidohydrolase
MSDDLPEAPIADLVEGADLNLNPDLVSDVIAMVAARTGELVSMRRWLHARPEPSRCEHETTAAIRERLLVEGLTPRVLTCGTGLACDVGRKGPIVALRADIDALSMTEAKAVPYRSINPGACHACGHDVHAAMVIGAGLVLRDLHSQGRMHGRVRLLFEPSEEAQPGGALDVIADGWLAGVSGIFGLHCDPKLDAGTLGCRIGPITSASDAIEIDLLGPGGHTARPHETVNLAEEAARLVLELPGAVSSGLADPLLARMVFGSIHTGSAPNVIPAEARLSGSLRTPDPAVWRALAGIAPAEVAAILGTEWHVTADGFAGRRSDGLEWAMRHKRGVPPVINDSAATGFMARAARAVSGPQAAVDTPHSWGGDTFGWYLHHVPGCYARLGTHWPDRVERLDLHRPDFDIDERAIPFGTTVLALTALAWLAGQTPGHREGKKRDHKNR